MPLAPLSSGAQVIPAVAETLGVRESGEGGVPFSALELRAGVAASELLTELAGLGELQGCQTPELTGAIEAIESSSVALWRGPSRGRGGPSPPRRPATWALS